MDGSQLESARQIVIQQWRSRMAVVLDTSGSWHTCNRLTCPIVHLRAHVCTQCKSIVPGPSCPLHPAACVLHVQDVYVCERVGCIHVCDRVSCASACGRCTVSGLACANTTVERDTVAASSSSSTPTSKRVRRKHGGVHTNHQSACIVIYDLLFSTRRRLHELKRVEGVFDIARRQAQRIVKDSGKQSRPVRVQTLIDIYAAARQQVRVSSHLVAGYSNAQKQEICRHYATIVVEIWKLVNAHMPCRCTFEGVLVALLYSMRRGVACDGVHAIPHDEFISAALPDAHSIAEIGLSRRMLTQSKNALFLVLQSTIASGQITVETFHRVFRNNEFPTSLSLIDHVQQ